MLQGKWKTQVLYEFCIYDLVRFGQLKKDLPGITNTMLSNTLRELEADGLISVIGKTSDFNPGMKANTLFSRSQFDYL